MRSGKDRRQKIILPGCEKIGEPRVCLRAVPIEFNITHRTYT